MRESTGQQWTPLTKDSDAVLIFLSSELEQTVEANDPDAGDLRRYHVMVVFRLCCGLFTHIYGTSAVGEVTLWVWVNGICSKPK